MGACEKPVDCTLGYRLSVFHGKAGRLQRRADRQGDPFSCPDPVLQPLTFWYPNILHGVIYITWGNIYYVVNGTASSVYFYFYIYIYIFFCFLLDDSIVYIFFFFGCRNWFQHKLPLV